MPFTQRLPSFLRNALAAVAALYLLAYVGVALWRIGYPFELEWLEGGSFNQLHRLLSGQPMYARPSFEYVPFIYPPLYYYLSYLVARVVGLGFAPLRIVSFVSSLGCFGIIFALVHRETRDRYAALLACGLFAATYHISGAWLDIARVDSLFLFFQLAAFYLVRWPSPRSCLLAGLCISLAYFTKQKALGFSAPLVLYCLLVNWRLALLLAGTFAATAGPGTWLLDRLYGGWYSFYVFELTSRFTLEVQGFVRYWLKDVLTPLGIALAAGAFYFVRRLRAGHSDSLLFYLLVAAGALGGSGLARMVIGGGPNAMLPAYAVIAVLFGLGVHQVLEAIRETPKEAQAGWLTCALFVGLVQMEGLVYNPLALVPTREDVTRGRELVATIRDIPGDVLVPYHGYLPVIAGKRGTANWAAIGDMLGDSGGPVTGPGKELASEIRRDLRERRFAAVLLDRRWYRFQSYIDRHYERRRSALRPGRRPPALEDPRLHLWPLWVYLPKGD